jgi:GTP pyrophosphokinase
MSVSAAAQVLQFDAPKTPAHPEVAALLNRLYATVGSYSAAGDWSLISDAYDLADMAHGATCRKSGEPYIVHPLAVANRLATMQLDAATIAAAILHDVVEDTDVSVDDLRERFGETVARLVDGVTKFSVVEKGHRERDLAAVAALAEREDMDRRKRTERERTRRAQQETLRKLFLTMAEDPRVVLIKLADRIHNMETIAALEPARQERLAEETMDIYAPLAGRLGVFTIKSELEDLAFAVLEPEHYAWVAGLLGAEHNAHAAYAERVAAVLAEQLEKNGLTATVSARAKHLWSIYNKLVSHGDDITQLYDLIAVRVIVETIPDCYQALGVVHSLWKPLPNRFKDYIGVPKSNGYQSLHTTVFCEEGRPTEIQIRTQDMHRVAEYGVATHWFYKERGGSVPVPLQMIRWVRQLMEWQKELPNAQELVDAVRIDIFEDQVFAFTPQGDIKDMPAGSTPVDFAYRVHTSVGHHCIGARVNSRLVPLDHKLQNGDVVEILTTKGERGPSRDWLSFVRSSTAQQRIRQWFKRMERQENIIRGRESLDKELKRLAVRSLDGINSERLREAARQMHYEELDDLFAAIGFGEATAQSVITRLGLRAADEMTLPAQLPLSVPTAREGAGLRVMGVGDLLTRLAVCCRPVPGDPIVGFITRGRGVTVHRADCQNVVREDEHERLVRVDWGPVSQTTYPVSIRIDAADREGLLRDVATVVAEENVNFTAANVATNADRTATITATVELSSIDQLSRILGKLERVRDVIGVARLGTGG